MKTIDIPEVDRPAGRRRAGLRGLPARLVGDRPQDRAARRQDRPDRQPDRRQRPAARRRRACTRRNWPASRRSRRRATTRRSTARRSPTASAAASSPAPPSSARATAPNSVFAWRSADDYPGIAYINNRKPGELYIVGGEVPDGRPTRCRPGPTSPRPMPPPASRSGAPTSTTRTPRAGGSATPTSTSWTTATSPVAGRTTSVLIDGDTGLILKVTRAADRRGAARRRRTSST